jgi:hypothetical protein
MSQLETLANLIAFFALQCFSFAMIVFTTGYVMKPLLDRWQAQDEALVESTYKNASN